MNPTPWPVSPGTSRVTPLDPPQSLFPMSTLIALAFGLILLLVIAPVLARLACRLCGLEKPNFRKVVVPSAVGIGFIIVAVVFYAALSMAQAPLGASAPVFLLTAAGFGFLGLFDDLYGSRNAGGFRGHLKSILQGRPTTGVFKLLGGAFVALAASYFLNGASIATAANPHLKEICFANFVLVAGIIALSANAVNLLDVRPGRAQFGFLLLCLPAVWGVFREGIAWITLHPPQAVLIGPVALAAMVEWWPDSAGRAMMGDTGSNLLGAVAGLAAATVLPLPGRICLFVSVLGINLLAERVSLSVLIAKSSILKRMDGWLGAR